MTQITQSLCWAGMLIALALANRAGLIADKSATTLFAVIPALWVASRASRPCGLRKAA